MCWEVSIKEKNKMKKKQVEYAWHPEHKWSDMAKRQKRKGERGWEKVNIGTIRSEDNFEKTHKKAIETVTNDVCGESYACKKKDAWTQMGAEKDVRKKRER